jgi:hypothetical protein
LTNSALPCTERKPNVNETEKIENNNNNGFLKSKSSNLSLNSIFLKRSNSKHSQNGKGDEDNKKYIKLKDDDVDDG